MWQTASFLCFVSLSCLSSPPQTERKNKINTMHLPEAFFKKKTAGVFLSLNRQHVPQLEDS